jgi:putative sugar O-methyltransferase
VGYEPRRQAELVVGLGSSWQVSGLTGPMPRVGAAHERAWRAAALAEDASRRGCLRRRNRWDVMTQFEQALTRTVAEAGSSPGYANYCTVRDNVVAMLNRRPAPATSLYWEEELEQFDYLFDAGPLVIRKLREHCHALTGIRAYDYRNHHGHRQALFAQKLAALHARAPEPLLIGEAALLGGFGHRVDDTLINIDTLKFYESLIALSLAGELDRLRKLNRPAVVWEIGGGWGGFAYQLKQLLPDVRLVMVDLPHTFLFSATYLTTAYPSATARFWDGTTPAGQPTQEVAPDFLFVPSDAVGQLPPYDVDLAVNMVSFQEMTSAQVEGYARELDRRGCPALYSHNRDRSTHNSELTRVSDILGRFFDLQRIQVLDVPYTSLKTTRRAAGTRSVVKRAARRAKHLLREAPAGEPAVSEYRHLIARPRG